MKLQKLFKLLLVFSLILLAFSLKFASISSVQADEYGPIEENKRISLDKKIANPNTGLWVDNLFASDYRFVPGQIVEFFLTITNTGNIKLENIHVKDTLPSQLTLISGALEFIINSLEPGQVYNSPKITVQVNQDFQIGLHCNLTNTAYVEVDTISDQDTAAFCVEKTQAAPEAVQIAQVMTKKMPEAGPKESLAVLLGVFALGFAGFVIVKNN